MTQACTQSTDSGSAEQNIDVLPLVPDPAGLQEAATHTVRTHLGLRATVYLDTGTPGQHPDQRPCPPWCWVGQDPASDHEIDPRRPSLATHSMEAVVSVMASRYRGARESRAGQDVIHTATLNARLEQVGQGVPGIGVSLHAAGEVKDVLLLSLADAQELAEALGYLVDVAEGRGRVPELGAVGDAPQ